MPLFLGIDTSNYTTSCALYDSDSKEVFQAKKLLPVAKSEKGLRQSDAVFTHIKQLSDVIGEAVSSTSHEIEAVCASVAPRSADGSYMPCFLVGKMTAQSIAAAMRLPFYECSHQEGHIVAALYSAGCLELLSQEFYAFHISGGTTEGLLVKPHDNLFLVELIAKTLDINAGQLIDRVGVMLGIDFPCGHALDKISQKSFAEFKIKPSFKGLDCNLSGGENKAALMIEKSEPVEDVAKFAIEYAAAAVDEMTCRVIEKHGEKPILYAGGVMSNTIIRKRLSKKYGGYFANPYFSSDNASGVAIIGAIKAGKEIF